MHEKKDPNVLPNLFENQQQQPNNPPLFPAPPRYNAYNHYHNNPFNQLFQKQPQYPHQPQYPNQQQHPNQPHQFPPNPYYGENQPNDETPPIPNPFGNPYNRSGF